MSDTKHAKAVADSPISLGKKGRVSGDIRKNSVCLQMGYDTETQRTDAGTVQL